MITWTPGPPRPDGRQPLKADVVNYRLTIYDQSHNFAWFLFVKREITTSEFPSCASGLAPDLKEAKIAVLDAMLADLTATRETLITEVFDYVRTL